MNYWGYRIDTNERVYFFEEIKKGNLRQGWGYAENQKLKDNKDIDATARRNLPIFNKVKKGDILLVPRIEEWDEVVIVEATEDFDTGYDFSIDPEKNDYGHIFPVQFIKRFSRNNDNVGGNIRETLKCRSRFWNINRCKEDIDRILAIDQKDLVQISNYKERFRKRVEASFDEKNFANNIYEKLNNDAQASEWEFLLCEGLRRMSPDSYSIETTSNRIENDHGADIIIRIPGIMDNSYIIAIQVKDHDGIVDKSVVKQICKADNYFSKEEGSTLIDKYIVLIKAKAEENKELIGAAEEANVKIIFESDVKKLLSKMARAFIADDINI